MAATAVGKKKGPNSRKPPAKKKQRNESLSSKNPRKDDILGDSDNTDEEVIERGQFDEEEKGSDLGSEMSSDEDGPLADDFLQGSDDEDGGTNVFFWFNDFDVCFCVFVWASSIIHQIFHQC